jgi:hypothetical protein
MRDASSCHGFSLLMSSARASKRSCWGLGRAFSSSMHPPQLSQLRVTGRMSDVAFLFLTSAPQFALSRLCLSGPAHTGPFQHLMHNCQCLMTRQIMGDVGLQLTDGKQRQHYARESRALREPLGVSSSNGLCNCRLRIAEHAPTNKGEYQHRR